MGKMGSMGNSGLAGEYIETTLIVPVYNEASRLVMTLPRLRGAFEHDPSVELVVVDDGSTDNSARTVCTLLRGWSRAQLVRLPWNAGKGAAVRAGVSVARGRRTAFMDADLSADLSSLPSLLDALSDADVAIGSRSIAGSAAVYETSFRRLTSKTFNGLVGAATGVVAGDTQCGFKAFRTPVAKMLFHLSRVDGFAFDVEVLSFAQLLGYTVAEVPIRWVEEPGSTVHLVRDALRMARDVVSTRRRCDRVARRQVPPPVAPESTSRDARSVSRRAAPRDLFDGAVPERFRGPVIDLTDVSPGAVPRRAVTKPLVGGVR